MAVAVRQQWCPYSNYALERTFSLAERGDSGRGNDGESVCLVLPVIPDTNESSRDNSPVGAGVDVVGELGG